MNNPFISVVIPCLNEEKVLPLLLADLQKQEYRDFDVYVVDGRSDDKTQKIVKEMSQKDKRFHLVESKRRNVGFQRNLGASKSEGTYILFLDADDRIPTFFLSGLHYHCAKNSEIDGFTTYIQADTENAKDQLFTTFMNTIIETSAKMNMPFAYGACIGCKRSVFEKLNGFDDEIMFAEDNDFVYRLAQAGYVFEVFREPIFTYSLRRFRKEGTLRLIRNLAPIGLKNLRHEKITGTVDAYPMLGGTYFNEVKKRKKKTFGQLKQIMQTLKAIVGSS